MTRDLTAWTDTLREGEKRPRGRRIIPVKGTAQIFGEVASRSVEASKEGGGECCATCLRELRMRPLGPTWVSSVPGIIRSIP